MATIEHRPDRVTAADLSDVLAADPTFSGLSAPTVDALAAADAGSDVGGRAAKPGAGVERVLINRG